MEGQYNVINNIYCNILVYQYKHKYIYIHTISLEVVGNKIATETAQRKQSSKLS